MVLEGAYTDKIVLKNTLTDLEELVFEAPDTFYPANSKKYFNMNYFALQMNLISDDLAKKLPPTDARLRPDLRAWENGDFDLATKEKDRLENNQRQRRTKVKAELK